MLYWAKQKHAIWIRLLCLALLHVYIFAISEGHYIYKIKLPVYMIINFWSHFSTSKCCITSLCSNKTRCMFRIVMLYILRLSCFLKILSQTCCICLRQNSKNENRCIFICFVWTKKWLKNNWTTWYTIIYCLNWLDKHLIIYCVSIQVIS